MPGEDILRLDGAYGEGGGQILRTALSLSVWLGRAFRMERIRAKRPRPGLRPQHLVAARAAAQVSDALLEGDAVGSQSLLFAPRSPARGGNFSFDVGATEAGGSAGSVSLVLQTVLPPLSMADAPSQVTVTGGTHVMWSPPVHYLAHVFLPTVAKLGFRAELVVETWGWYPKGGGVVRARILPWDPPEGKAPVLDLNRRGRLARIWGISAASNLPNHVVQRQKRQAEETLRKAGLRAEIEEIDAPSPGPGTVVFLVAEYAQALAGFTAYGALRKPAEKVAREAARQLVKFHRSKAAIEPHLADQLLLPIVMSGAEASFTISEATAHLTTNAWVIEQFLGALVEIRPKEGGTRVIVNRRGQHV